MLQEILRSRWVFYEVITERELQTMRRGGGGREQIHLGLHGFTLVVATQ